MIELALPPASIFHSDAAALVNPVNCVGVMGAGLAYQFKRHYPKNNAEYVAACRRGLQIGQVCTTMEAGKYIINVPTKQHWKDSSKLEYIESGLTALIAEMIKHNITSVAIPALGCGLGGLEWQTVHAAIIAAFTDYPDILVVLFPPR